MIHPPRIVVTLLGSLQIKELTALARDLCSGGTMPIRNESARGEDMFISAARTTYSVPARRGSGANAIANMNTVELPWAKTMALTVPSFFERNGLPIAASAIVMLETARSGPL